MPQRFLFIGTGGSGGETVRYLYRELGVRLARAGISSMPMGWQFVHIDAPVVSEEDDDLPALPKSCYRSLSTSKLEYATVEYTLRRGPGAEECAGWLPDAREVNVDIQWGAGQFRAIGRALTLAALPRIYERLSEAAHRLDDAEAIASMVRVADALGRDATNAADREPAVVVVSSLAGGTGSGTVLDVCDLLRQLPQAWAADSTAVLYAPDVFQSLDTGKRQGIQANALATVAELLAGYWNTDPDVDPAHALIGAQGGRATQRRGPGRSLLVGSRNDVEGGLTLQRPKDVFAAVGRMLSAWATNPSIQHDFNHFVRGNRQQGALGLDPLGLSGEVEAPMSAFGYASVRLGRDLFLRYASQCLARVMAGRLLHGSTGSLTVDVDSVDHVDPDERVRRRWNAFLEAVEVDSPGGLPAGRLRERLSPPRSATLAVIADEIRRGMGELQRPASLWRRYIEDRVAERQADFLAQQRTDLAERARPWASNIEGILLREVERIVATDGLSTAERLVRRLYAHVGSETVQHLQGAILEDRDRAKRFGDEIAGALGTDRKGLFSRRPHQIPAHSPRVQSAIAQGVEAGLGRALDAEVRLLVAGLLRDLAMNLVRPLAEALAHGRVTLQRDVLDGADGRRPEAARWPTTPTYAVPSALRPSPTEFLIDPADGYPDILAGLLDTPDQLGAGLARAAQQILTGNGLRDPKTGTAAGSLIRVTRSWRPEEVRVWTNQRELEQAGSFELRTSAQDLLEEGRRWADDDGRLIGRYVHQSLADALSTEPDRLGRFRRALGMALRASQPLIQMDPAFQRLDPTFTGSPPRPMITAIPLAPGTAAYEAALETLINHGDIPEEVASTAFDSAGSNEIEIATFLSRSTHPAAFFSLTDPILRNWSRHGAQGRRSEFVRWRRARALPRATPMTSAARRDLVRGFLIALVDDLVAPATDGQQVVVTDPDSARQFPCTLLGPAPDAGDPFDWLGAIVESLALLCVAVISDPPSMHAYQTLVLLGRNRRLRMEPAAALGRLKKLRETAIQRYPLVGSPHQRRRAWDLRADIHTELDALVRQAGGEE